MSYLSLLYDTFNLNKHLTAGNDVPGEVIFAQVKPGVNPQDEPEAKLTCVLKEHPEVGPVITFVFQHGIKNGNLTSLANADGTSLSEYANEQIIWFQKAIDLARVALRTREPYRKLYTGYEGGSLFAELMACKERELAIAIESPGAKPFLQLAEATHGSLLDHKDVWNFTGRPNGRNETFPQFGTMFLLPVDEFIEQQRVAQEQAAQQQALQQQTGGAQQNNPNLIVGFASVLGRVALSLLPPVMNRLIHVSNAEMFDYGVHGAAWLQRWRDEQQRDDQQHDLNMLAKCFLNGPVRHVQQDQWPQKYGSFAQAIHAAQEHVGGALALIPWAMRNRGEAARTFGQQALNVVNQQNAERPNSYQGDVITNVAQHFEDTFAQHAFLQPLPAAASQEQASGGDVVIEIDAARSAEETSAPVNTYMVSWKDKGTILATLIAVAIITYTAYLTTTATEEEGNTWRFRP